MKITVEKTTIEATAEDLKASNTVAGNVLNIIRNAFGGVSVTDCEELAEDEEEE